MAKRVIDFNALWGSDKLAACALWARREYAWLYGLADCAGSFELTNLRVVWGRVAANRPDLSLRKLEKIFNEFHAKGLLFIWEDSGKRYGHWTGSDRPGRLPRPSWRERLERFAPEVPEQKLLEYVNSFSSRNITHRREETHAQGLDLGLDRDKKPPLAQASPSQEGFDGFWKVYPRKVAKPAAVSAWRKIEPGELPAILRGIQAWKQTEQWSRDGGRFIPYPATFLNQRRWEELPTSHDQETSQPRSGAGDDPLRRGEIPEWGAGARA
ncbi:MAG: hypothetical protein WAR21_14340 [Candidatus Acidiferrales bacterium]